MSEDKDVTEMTTEEVVESYRWLVERAIRSLWSRCIATMTVEDMRACGYEGLLQAHQNYEPDSDAAFPSYASQRVRGAIIDGRRRAGWGPRTRKTRCHDHTTADKLEGATRMESAEIASKVTEGGKNEMPAMDVLLMEPAEMNQMNLAADHCQDEQVTRQQLKSLVSEAMDRLGDIERAIVRTSR